MSHVLSIAYGSNLHPHRIRERVPGAQALGVVSLPGYTLAFHKRSKDSSGKAMLYKADDAIAYGVVYAIPSDEKHVLNTAEGLGAGYEEREIKVELNGTSVDALIYMASPSSVDHRLQPYHWYKKLVLAGAAYHRFPASYMVGIGAVASIQDLDKKRSDLNEALLRGML
jgi:gamma-glutamylcyclotransferase